MTTLTLFYNFSNLATLTDFVENTGMYQYFRILKVQLILERSVDESTMMNGIHGSSLLLNYNPTYTSVNYPFSALSRDQSAYKIDQMTFDPQVVEAPIYNIQAYESSLINNSMYLPTERAGEIGGQFCLASDNTTLNSTTVKLFNVKIVFYVHFAYRDNSSNPALGNFSNQGCEKDYHDDSVALKKDPETVASPLPPSGESVVQQRSNEEAKETHNRRKFHQKDSLRKGLGIASKPKTERESREQCTSGCAHATTHRTGWAGERPGELLRENLRDKQRKEGKGASERDSDSSLHSSTS